MPLRMADLGLYPKATVRIDSLNVGDCFIAGNGHFCRLTEKWAGGQRWRHLTVPEVTESGTTDGAMPVVKVDMAILC